MVLNDTKLILNYFKGVTHAHLRPVWYHSLPPLFPTPGLGTFFAISYSKLALAGYEKTRLRPKKTPPVSGSSSFSKRISGAMEFRLEIIISSGSTRLQVIYFQKIYFYDCYL